MELNAGVAMREVPDEILPITEGFESFRATAYDDKQPDKIITRVEDIIGTPTIGYGHTRNVTGLDVVNRTTITKDQGLAYLKQDYGVAVADVYKTVKAAQIDKLTTDQWAALLDFVFNCGVPPAISSLLNAGKFDQITDHMSLYVNSKGVRMEGLVRRRRMEIDLWKQADTSSAPVAMTDPVDPTPQPSLLQPKVAIAAASTVVSSTAAAAAAAIPIITPAAANNHILGTALTVLTIVAAVSASLAVMIHSAQTKAGVAT